VHERADWSAATSSEFDLLDSVGIANNMNAKKRDQGMPFAGGQRITSTHQESE
jgi:hypothetical protein